MSSSASTTPRYLERVPLLKKKTEETDATPMEKVQDHIKGHVADLTAPLLHLETDHNQKMTFYDPHSLLSQRSVLIIGRSAFMQRPVLLTFVNIIVTVLITSLCVAFCVPKARLLDTETFQRVGQYLSVFITFMLGLYIVQAFGRWRTTVCTFEEFLISIRQLVFMLHSIRIPPDVRLRVEHYAIASGYLLNTEARNAQAMHAEQREDVEELLDWLEKKSFLYGEDAVQLKRMVNDSVHDERDVFCTRCIWTWIGELLHHPLNEDGLLISPPLQARLFALVQDCICKIEALKINIVVQTPFMYAHLLAFLVHVNNIILAVAYGISIGAAIYEVGSSGSDLTEGKAGKDVKRQEHLIFRLYGAIQVSMLQVVQVMLTPVLNVAFLHIAHVLCYPFGDEAYHLPTETFIARNHNYLWMMSENRKYFRQRMADDQTIILGKDLTAEDAAKAERKKKKKKKKDEDEIEEEENEEDEGGDDDDGGDD